MSLSFVQYVGNGSTKIFAVPFPYLEQADVSLKVNGVSTPFTWDDAATVRLSIAPPSGHVVEVRRTTPRDNPKVNFVDGAVLSEKELDLAINQVFYIVQEALDIAGGTLALLGDGSYSASNRRISNAANPTSAQDVVTKAWAENSMQSQLAVAILAKDTAVSAKTAAEASQSSASTSASLASTSASNAATSASSASTSALNAANDASDADEAKADAFAYRSDAAFYAAQAHTSAEEAAQSAEDAALFDPATYAPKASPAFTGTATFASRPTFAGAVPWDSSNYLPEWPAGCRLVYVSSTQIRLDRYRGRFLVIAGERRIIPVSGTTLSTSGLTASTTYLIYARWTGSAIALEASTTDWVFDLGVPIKSSDSTRTLVGKIYVSSDGLIYDDITRRHVLSYWNRLPLHLYVTGNPTVSATTSTMIASVWGHMWKDSPMMMWAHATPTLAVNGFSYMAIRQGSSLVGTEMINQHATTYSYGQLSAWSHLNAPSSDVSAPEASGIGARVSSGTATYNSIQLIAEVWG